MRKYRVKFDLNTVRSINPETGIPYALCERHAQMVLSNEEVEPFLFLSLVCYSAVQSPRFKARLKNLLYGRPSAKKWDQTVEAFLPFCCKALDENLLFMSLYASRLDKINNYKDFIDTDSSNSVLQYLKSMENEWKED